MMRFACLVAGLLLVSSPAYAYIDPGVLGVLYQAAYALIFGTFLADIGYGLVDPRVRYS